MAEMTDKPFDYQAVLKADMSGTITSLIAYQVLPDSPLQAVIWSVPRKDWIYAPALAVPILYDHKYQGRTRVIDRLVAEEIAREVLRVELPSETALLEMCQEGERMGWEYGPPRP
ncbi:hypothetical protein Asp14428_47580 [Actinoplanes sp. NBRC 14428]|nr:hypothetical protein Asp14428_47580 [Actinoplanes sp. NBRC 14428]